MRHSRRTKAQKMKTEKERKIEFEQPATAGGTSSTDMLHLLELLGLVPCYPSCRLLPTFVHRGLPSTPPVAPTLPVALDATHSGCAALPTPPCLINVLLRHDPFGFLRGPPVPLPLLLCCSGPQRSPLQITKGDVPLILRWLGTPQGRRHPSSPQTLPDWTNRSLLCRATPPAKKSHR